MFGKMSRMKSSEMYKYSVYFGMGATALVVINELSSLINNRVEFNCVYCIPGLVGALVFHSIVSNVRWMSKK